MDALFPGGCTADLIEQQLHSRAAELVVRPRPYAYTGGPVASGKPTAAPLRRRLPVVTWIAPDTERSEHYPARRNDPEQVMLRDWLDWHRATLLRKCAGLDATQLATRAVPPSNLSLLGLVRHMSDTERGWVRQTFRGEQVPDLYYRSDTPDADFEEAGPAGAEADFGLYLAECRAVDAALEGAELDDTFTLQDRTISVRWMWQHLVEEYARHNGHADLLRQAIDGAAGL